MTGTPSALRSVRFWVNVCLGAAAAWLALRHVPFDELRQSVAAASPGWTLAALASVLLTLALVVVRWRLLFIPDQRARSWRNLTYGVVVGQAVNIALPIRLGEVVRACVVSAAEGVPLARVLATLAVERTADLVASAAAAAVLLVMVTLPEWMRASGVALAATGGLALAAVLIVGFRSEWAADLGGWAPRLLPHRLLEIVRRHTGHANAGLAALRDPASSVLLWSLTFAIAALAASTNFLLFQAFSLALPPLAALFVLVVLQVGTTAVSVPGNVGVFHYVTMLALAVYWVDEPTALAYAVVLWAVAHLPKIVLGALVMAAGPSGFSLRTVLNTRA